MTARLRVRRIDATHPDDFHHAEEQVAAIMRTAVATSTCLVLGPTETTGAEWLPVHWNPAKVRVAGERAGVRS